ncbi:MAG: DNA repair protein RecN [Opitutia bacterium]|jgi:DNA repair protein RecN (Recombination protein N)
MIRRLAIRDLALMDRAELELGPGFTVVTGETGAGKSVLLGALSLLAGHRAPKTVVRKGADAAVVEAELAMDDPALDALLREMDLPPCDDGLLLLRRTVSATQAGRVTVNGGSATLAQLARLGERWIDFHGPGEPQRLMRETVQLQWLDAHAGPAHASALAAFAEEHAAWRGVHQRIDALRGAERLSEDEAAFVRSQLEKFEGLDLADEAVDTLERDHAVASRAQELLALLAQLDSGLGGQGVGAALPRLLKAAAEAASIDPSLAEARSRLESLAAEAEDLRADLSRAARQLGGGGVPASLERRMNAWLDLRRRYGPDAASVRAKRDALAARLAGSEGADARIAELQAEADAAEVRLRASAKGLRKARQKASLALAESVRRLLGHLGFRKADFRAEVVDADLSATGDSAVRFLFCPNAGQDLLPLSQIASSGEAARVMLALKTTLAAADRTPVLVFDEVDANVGGEVGAQVGRELAALGAAHQVVCVTHLPQVAALGHRHLVVTKDQDDRSTTVRIAAVDADKPARLGELARMLGDRSSKSALAHARELLDAR